MKILVVSNNIMSMPVLQMLAHNKWLCAVACAAKLPEHKNFFKQFSQQTGVPVTQLQKVNFDQKLDTLMVEHQADMVVVYCFAWLIPERLLKIPRLGFINMHAGPLPEMRGVDPIFETIRQRKAFGGMTIHRMDKTYDTGNIIKKENIPMNPEYTYGMLSRQLAMIGAKLLQEIIHTALKGEEIEEYKQDEINANYYGKITPEQVFIKWQEMTAAEIKALVKACNPSARCVPTRINEWIFGITEVADVNLEGNSAQIQPGTILALDRQNGMVVFCKDGKGLNIEIVYTEDAFMPGYKLEMYGIKVGMCFL